jgi:hypothetical protein
LFIFVTGSVTWKIKRKEKKRKKDLQLFIIVGLLLHTAKIPTWSVCLVYGAI